MKIEAVLSPRGDKSISDVIADKISDVSDTASVKSSAGGLGRWLAKGAAKLAGAMGDTVTVSLLSAFKSTFTGLIEKYLKKYSIPADFEISSIRKQDEDLVLELNITQIDYAGLASRYVPILLNTVKAKKPDMIVNPIAAILGSDATALAVGALNTVSDEKKEQILHLLAEQYQPWILSRLNGILSDQKMDLAAQKVAVVPTK